MLRVSEVTKTLKYKARKQAGKIEINFKKIEPKEDFFFILD